MHEPETASVAAVTRSIAAGTQPNSQVQEDVQTHRSRVERRSFLKGIGLAGAAAVPGGALFAEAAVARTSGLSAGDIAILRFLAAAELIGVICGSNTTSWAVPTAETRPTSPPSPISTPTWRSTSPTTPMTNSAMPHFSMPT